MEFLKYKNGISIWQRNSISRYRVGLLYPWIQRFKQPWVCWETHEYGGPNVFTVLHHFIEELNHLQILVSTGAPGTCLQWTLKNKSRISKRYLHIHVHSSIIHYSQAVGAAQALIDRWMINQKHSMNIQSMIQLLKERSKFWKILQHG